MDGGVPNPACQPEALAAMLSGLPEIARAALVDPVPPRNWNDWSALAPEAPAALFCPRSAEQVSAILAAANAARVRWCRKAV